MPRADTSDEKRMALRASRNWREVLSRADWLLREWISRTRRPASLQSSAKNWVMRAVTKKTITLDSGSAVDLARREKSVGRSSWRRTTMENWSRASAAWSTTSPTQSTYRCAAPGRRACAATWRTAAGTVAEKSSVWRAAGGGRQARMRSMVGLKPMSRSWSASSNTRLCRRSKACTKPSVFFMWSSSLPGVAISSGAGPPRRRRFFSAPMLVPPIIT
mmetsp:Transcript_11286/g.38476  ORF Transcript_11286/g.38476 Transcript_11286/m.38476 type:complete len:218 (+) Transcript_11286:1174-1827(+)